MTWHDFFAIIFLIAGNAYFVAAEFGLVSARRSVIELQALNGSNLAKTTLKAMEKVSVMLAGAQLGVTLCSLGLGAIGEPLIARLLEQPFTSLHVSTLLLHPFSIAVALLIMTYLHVVFGEMIPKNLALAGPDRAAIALTPTLFWLVRIFYPLVISLNALASVITRLFGISPKDEITSSFTRDEVAGFVEESHREGLLNSDEEQLLRGSLRFDQKLVGAIIIPVEKLIMTSVLATPTDIEKLVAQTGYSRFPVQNKLKKLVGYVHLKDMLDIPRDDYNKPLPKHEIRPLPVVKTQDSLHDALIAMQRSGAHMAQVANSRGRVLGVIMLEDALEDLVGEIRDDGHSNN
ncbi:MAG: hemolysin family protein [Patescibacteria group bacterium]|nr:hemolysin family protein [Patescibacteria group bacterium]